VLRHGKFTKLPGLKSTDGTRAAAINARGDIVGTSEDTTGGQVSWHAVIWPAAHPGTVRELVADGPAPTWAQGVDVDDNGTVLGFVGQRPTEGQHPYVWPAVGPGRPLVAPAGYGYPEGTAIRAGWVAGTAFGPDGSSAAVRWRVPSGAATVLPGGFGTAVAVNLFGSVAADNAVIHLGGRIRSVSGEIKVLADWGVAAGTAGGAAVVWIGC